MYVKFKGDSKAYACADPVEQKVFQSGTAVGWAVTFHLHGNFSSSEIDELITPESISELVFTSENEENQAEITITGYSAVRACTIRHRDGTATAELQFTKGATKNGTV